MENPLAKEISTACAKLGLETLFEPDKTHPKDWSNPGRVKVRVKGGRNATVKTSMDYPARYVYVPDRILWQLLIGEI